MEKWRVAGSGPRFIRLGPRMIVYDTEDLDTYMAERHARSTSERKTVAALAGTGRAANRIARQSLDTTSTS
jgi:hypothetical protein